MLPPPKSVRPPEGQPEGFTLVELLVAMTVLALLVLCLSGITEQTSKLWRQTSARVEAFREARNAYEAMTRQIGQATLNTYQDYYGYADSAHKSLPLVPRTNRNADGSPGGNVSTFIPVTYERQSELRFFCGPSSASITSTYASAASGTATQWPSHCLFFQAPLGYTETGNYAGLTNLVNTWGYYIEYTSASDSQPPFVATPSTRFRLMELMEPSECLTVYNFTSGNPAYTGMDWFKIPLQGGAAPAYYAGGTASNESFSRVLAENIVALIILPKLSPQDEAAGFPGVAPGTALAPNYGYDSSSTGQAASYTGTQAGLVNSKDQLPPTVQVTMVAIDQVSANRLNAFATANNQTPAQALGLDKLFTSTGDKSANLAADLGTAATPSANNLTANLVKNHLTYRVFSSDVTLLAAKWSGAQTQ